MPKLNANICISETIPFNISISGWTFNSETVRNGGTEISVRLYVCCHINIIKRAHKIVHNFRKTTAFKIGLGDQKGQGHLILYR